MLAKYYLEIDFICMIVLISLVYHTLHSNFKKTNQRRFLEVLIMNIIFVLSDTIWIFNNEYAILSNLMFGGRTFGYIMNGINVCVSALAGWSWLRFSENFQEHHAISSRKYVILSLIPCMILFLLTITTDKTHLLFYINENGQFVRESGSAIQLVIAYSYILVAVILSLLHARSAVTEQARARSIGIASYVIFPAIACVIQLFVPNMSIVFIGTIVSLLNVYITLQGQQVLNDPLTGLNNRMLLDQKVMEGIQAVNDRYDLWLLIMDANKFKGINDTYGHLEGDRALKRIADALKKTFSNSRDFICRYGGDEFVVLHKTEKNKDCSELTANINRLLAQYELPYVLSVSVGAAKYTDDIKTWSQLMERADEELYKVKKSR